MNRSPRITVRFPAVAALLGALLATAAIAPRLARSEEASVDPAADLRLAARTLSPTGERVAAATRLTAPGVVVPDADRGLQAATSLLRDAPEVAGRLARASLDAGVVSPETRRAASATAKALLEASPKADATAVAAWAAVRLLLGAREDAAALRASGAGTPFLREVERRDAPEFDPAKGAPDAAAWSAHDELAALLDRAVEDDPAVSRPALDALRAKGAAAVPLLLATASLPRPTPPGLLPRRVRSIVVLGVLGDRRAVEPLTAALDDHDDGWVRVAAVNALGDLGDPRAVAPLCHVLFYLGDLHRPRDSWEYPGQVNTDVPPDRWNDVDYFAIDSNACDTLLRLGVANAGEWLIRERLDPRSGRWRIRVLHDAVDAIRRAFPGAPKGYEPDAGLPERQAATDALLAWWRTGPRLAHPLDENDPGFRAEAKALVDRIGAKSVMELQIAKRAAALVGPAMTPSILEGLAASKKRVQRAELALVLGAVRDRRAVAPLMALSKDEVPAVRANAAEGLVAYADPPDPAWVANASEVTPDAIVARWIEMLDDEEGGPRASALKALASLPPRADVRAAIDAHAPAAHPENDFGDYVLAERVVRLVQTGEGLDAVRAVLDEPDLFRRRYTWELLRVALRLGARDFDPTPAPDAPGRKPLDAAHLQSALDARRAR